MDIKNALNAILPLNLRAKTETDRTIKAGNTNDRDANGQMAYDQNQHKQEEHPPMTDEQLQRALKALQEFPAVKEHNLTVELIEQEGRKFVLLKEPDGKILRRISEAELWTLPVMKQADPKAKGQLLRRTA